MAFPKRYIDPDSNLIYGFDWSDWLGSATIAASEWVVPDGVTSSATSFNDTTTLTFISILGFTEGDIITIVNRITTSLGEIEDRSIMLIVKER